MSKESLELEKKVMEILFSLENQSIEDVYMLLSTECSFVKKSQISMVARCLYHVSFSRIRLLFPLCELAKKIGDGLEKDNLELYQNALMVPVLTYTTKDEESGPELDCTAHPSVLFYGYLAYFGVINIIPRIRALFNLFGEEEGFARDDLMSTLIPLLVPCAKIIQEQLPDVFHMIEVYYVDKYPDLLKELHNFLEVGDPILSSPCRQPGFDTNSIPFISDDATIQLIISNDDDNSLQIFSTNYDFDFDRIMKLSIISPSVYLTLEPTILCCAAVYGSVKCFKFLLFNKAKAFEFSNIHLIDCAVLGGNIEIIRLCLEEKYPFDTALFTAVDYHRTVLIDWLLENNLGSYNSNNMNNQLTLMHAACETNNLEFAERLIEHGYQIESNEANDYLTPFQLACSYDCVNMVFLLCTSFPNIEHEVMIDGLMTATLSNSHEVVRYLIDKCTPFLTQDDFNKVIHSAEINQLTEMKNFLTSFI